MECRCHRGEVSGEVDSGRDARDDYTGFFAHSLIRIHREVAPPQTTIQRVSNAWSSGAFS